MSPDIRINRRGALGDVLLMTPVIRELKRQHPDAKIYVSTDSPEIFHGNRNVRLASKQKLEEPFIDLDMAYENRPMTQIIDAYAEVAGVKVEDQQTEIFPHADDDHYIHEFMSHRKWCALGCTPTTWLGKNWPMSKWNQVAIALFEKGWGVVLVGKGNRPPIKKHLDLTERTSVQELAAALRRCQLFIGHDSFPMHCAIAVGIRSVGLFGVTLPEIVLPRVKNALAVVSDPKHPNSGGRHQLHGCTFYDCLDQNPMDSISVEQVLAMV